MTENLTLLGSALSIIGSLVVMVRYLLKLNWKLKREADQAKASLVERQITELENSLLIFKTQMANFTAKMEVFSGRLDKNREAADGVVTALRSFVERVDRDFEVVHRELLGLKETQENFGKIIFKK